MLSQLFRRAPRRRLVAVASAVAALAAVVSLPTPASAAVPLAGADVSWPQCPAGTGTVRKAYGLPMPVSTARFVVIGLTDGPGFTPNPCLGSQVAWAKAHHVWTAAYAVATYPTNYQFSVYGKRGPYSAATVAGRLANTGYAQAAYNVANLRRAGLVTPMIWIDVETYPFRPWTVMVGRNRPVVAGLVTGYRRAGYRVGFYSTRSQWSRTVGALSYRVPEWHTAGPRSRAVALTRCSEPSFNGGRTILAQFWGSSRDSDLTCPAYSSTAVLGTYFHRY